MRALRWLRRMLGADTVLPVRRPPRPNDRDRRVAEVVAKAERALAHRARIDAEVERVEQYLRGTS